MSLIITIALLVGQLVIMLFSIWQERKPIDPLRPKLLPYRLVMLVLAVTMFATLAHLMAVVTGNPIVPTRKMGM